MANLRIPGPTPIPDDVRAALSTQMINHRGPEFAALLERVTEGLRPFFRTESDILIYTCSGTGVLEAAIVNTLSPGDKVLAISIGSFGDRFGAIAETYGAEVERLNIEWGGAAEPDAVRDALRGGDYQAVLVTHNETSTGVENPLRAIAQVVRAESKALLLVDAVSSMGCVPIETDNWGIDVIVTGSQKGWEVPPGLAMAAVGPRGWEAFKRAKMPRFYLDFGKHKDFADKGQPPWTPALPVMFGLDVSLKRMADEGPGAIFDRHAAAAANIRGQMRKLGLELFADERYASNTVTAVKVPTGVDGKALTAKMRTDYDTVIAGGQGKLAGQIFRFGHLGWFEQQELDDAVDALRKTLVDLGYRIPAGASA
ncbi:MAG: aspartate aminotransferase [Chloroflexi bacterium]|nr:MAG: aspartate aminotransferase [Chloroflexota bacterium]